VDTVPVVTAAAAQILSLGHLSKHTLAYIAIGVVVLVVLLLLVALLGRGRPTDESERFRRVRDMTTAWSQGRPTPPPNVDANGNKEHRRDRTG
jgi:hypothetical protein